MSFESVMVGAEDGWDVSGKAVHISFGPHTCCQFDMFKGPILGQILVTDVF